MTREKMITKAHARIKTALKLLRDLKSCREEVEMLTVLEERIRRKINESGFEK